MIKADIIQPCSHLSEQNYLKWIAPYVDALEYTLHRMERLHKEYVCQYQTDPIHHIQRRIKSQKSIADKLRSMQLDPTLRHAHDYLTDIAGIRMVCHFVRDVDRFVEIIKHQIDLIIIKERDYIRQPKSNGYRSYHIVFAVPVNDADSIAYYPVELQLRTLSMDLWASMEHRICYKSEELQPMVQEMVIEEFLEYARQLEEMEVKMERYCEGNT